MEIRVAESSVWEYPKHMGGCQHQGPFLGILNNRCRIIIGTPKRDHNFDNHPHT